MDHFPRPILAKTLADGLQGHAVFGDSSSGLFLAAPRRTGKSTFLMSDLRPELEARGILVVYCDLWADQKRDPAALISDTIGAALARVLGPVARTAKSMGLDEVNIAGTLKIDTKKIGRVEGSTLTDALRSLHTAAKKPVALIIDEAQQALTSDLGESAMMALKSARDQLNQPGDINLMLIMSGSDRDKLLRLVNTTSAPFYGSAIQKMPDLGRDFVTHVARLVERQRPDLVPADIDKLLVAFNMFSCRPQFFAHALGEVLNPLNQSAARFEDVILRAAFQRSVDDEQQMASDFLSLKPVEQAVLWRLLEQGSRFRAYDADALNFYADSVGERITPAQVQHVLDSLRNRAPALVWKSARGEYAIDEAMMYPWYSRRKLEGTWPPVAPERPPPQQTQLDRLRSRARRHAPV